MKMIIQSNADRDAFIKALSNIDCTKHKYSAEFKIYRKQRTLSQNRLYYLWINAIHIQTGNDKEALHEMFKRDFIPWTIVEVFDEEIKVQPSTKRLNTKQFTEFLNMVQSKMNDYGIVLPMPGDQYWEQFYAKYEE